MKNKLLFLTFVLLLTTPSFSSAQIKPSSTSTIRERVEERKEKRQNFREEIEERKESIKNSVDERRQNALVQMKDRIDRFSSNMRERFDAAIERLETLSARIESRISKLESEKIDVSKAKTLMADARTKIETAKTSVLGVKPMDTSVSSTSATTTKDMLKVGFKDFKAQIEKASKDIKSAHSALIKVVENLKPGQAKLEKIQASSTPEQNTN